MTRFLVAIRKKKIINCCDFCIRFVSATNRIMFNTFIHIHTLLFHFTFLSDKCIIFETKIEVSAWRCHLLEDKCHCRLVPPNGAVESRRSAFCTQSRTTFDYKQPAQFATAACMKSVDSSIPMTSLCSKRDSLCTHRIASFHAARFPQYRFGLDEVFGPCRGAKQS